MTTHAFDIRLERVNYLRGPNIWTYRSVLEVWLDLGELENWPSSRLPGFNDRLTALLPTLEEHHCGVGERGGFLQRLHEGTWMGHVLEHVVIELLNLADMPTAFGQTRSTSRAGVYRMVFRARDEQVARVALAEGHALLMAVIRSQPFGQEQVQAAVGRIRTTVDDCYLGPSTAAIVNAAADRRIPHIRLNDGNLVQLGYGAAQRRIWTAESDSTSAIGESIAGDKDLTKTLLAACGIPVPEGQVVESAAAAWEAAEDIGLPVAVKPSDANHGTGVSLDLRTQAEVEAAFAIAEPQGSEVIVERFVPGIDHRLLVVGGRVVAASRGQLTTVTGDGRCTVAELIDSQLNSDPRRGVEEDFPLSRIELDQEPVIVLELQRQGLSAGSVPAAGREVIVQRNGNLSEDCTDDVHPEVAHAATLAARVVGLDIAGIDIVCRDIGRPLAAQGGAIVEVNAGPGLLMHLKPAMGAPRPVGRAICEHLFPEDEADDGAGSGRIPVVGITGTRDTATVARLVAWLLQLSGRYTGLACAKGLYLDNRQVEREDSAHFDAAHRLLINRNVQAAVIENGPASILRDGLAYDRCQIGIVTDMDGADALTAWDVQGDEQMYKVIRSQVDVVLPGGTAVLAATLPRALDLAELSDGDAILYGMDPALAAIGDHRSRGGRAVFVRQQRVVLATGASEVFLPDLGKMINGHGRGQSATVSLLAAVAAAWALGIAPALIGAGIEAFEEMQARAEAQKVS
jgi:cyanophycin synthetase